MNNTDQEKQALRFLNKIGFRDVNGGNTFVLGGRQVDACGGYDDTLVIVECTLQQNLTGKIDSIKGRRGEIISGIRKIDNYSEYKSFRFVMLVENQEIPDAVKIHAMSNKGNEVYIWDRKFIDYYLALEKSIPGYAIFSLLSELNIRPPVSDSITVPASLVKLGKGKDDVLLLFFIKSKDLLKYAYVARRSFGAETFYQRMVNKTRLLQISRYINKGKIFPNSIVVALEDHGYRFVRDVEVDTPSWEEVGKLTLGLSYSSCWVIDGQHRLLSYAHTTQNGILAVSAFGKISQKEQAEYFLDINKNARHVDPNLLWDLLGSISPLSIDGFISNSVKELNCIEGGFFYKKINIPSMGKGPFNFNNLCDSIREQEFGEKEIGSNTFKKIKNPFWNSDPIKYKRALANGLDNFFSQIDTNISNDKKNGIWTDGFISVLIALFKIYIVCNVGLVDANSINKIFLPLFNDVNTSTNDELKTIRRRLSSEGGKLEFKQELIRRIQDGVDADFGKGLLPKSKTLGENINELEMDLNKLVNLVLSKKFGPDWYNNQQLMPDTKERERIIKNSRKENNQPWEHLNFNTTILSIITNKSSWDSTFESIFLNSEISNVEELKISAVKLWAYRSRTHGHKRSALTISKEEETLVKTYYSILNKTVQESLKKFSE